MTDVVPGVAERLVREFGGIPPMEVLEAVCTCAAECDEASPMFVEQSARASLHARGD